MILYLRGRYLLNKRTPDSIQKGRILFEQAVAKDPRFALGHAGIADSYILLGKIGELSADEATTGRGRRFQSRSHSTTIWLRATFPERRSWPISIGTGQPPRPTSQKAIELNSNSADAHHWYARHLAQIGRFDEAQPSQARRRRALRPDIAAFVEGYTDGESPTTR